MHRITALFSGAALWLLMAPVPAITILQCEDADGNVSFQEHCPDGTRPVVSRKIRTEAEKAAARLDRLQREKPVVVFRVDDCEACDQVGGYLRCRGIPFTEKDVSEDRALQEELIVRTGELSVPVVTIGGEVVDGYSDEVLRQSLDAAGYPDNSRPQRASVEAVSQRLWQ